MLRPDTFALTVLLAALTGLAPLSTDLYLPSLPEIAQKLQASTAQTQLTISAYLVGFALGQLVYGPLSDRYGRKPVLLAALAFYMAASFICTLATSIEMLIAARAVQAIGGCGSVVLARAVVRDLYSGARAGRELSLMALVMALAPVVAPMIGGVLQTAFGWRASFFALMMFGVALGAAIWLLLPETLERRHASEPAVSLLRAFGGFLGDGGFVAHTALVVVSYAGLFAWISVASFVLQDIYGLSPFAFGVAFAVASAGVIAGSAFGSRFLGSLGFNALLGIGTAAQAVGGLLMVAAIALEFHAVAFLIAPMAIYLAGLGMILPQGVAGAMQPYGDRAGAASSLIGFLQQSAAALCGIAVGQMLGKTAWPMAAAIAAMGVLSLIVWATTRAVRERALRHH